MILVAISVSAAGDINGDGYADLLIGAFGYPNGTYKGRSYVVFGGPGVGGSGDILLSSLNGPMALNWMGKIMVMIVVFQSAPREISMEMAMLT